MKSRGNAMFTAVALALGIAILGLTLLIHTGAGQAQGPVPRGTWVHEIADGEGIAGLAPSLALDSGGKAHIVYGCQRASGATVLQYAARRASGWERQMIDTAPASGSLVLDAAGVPHVAYTHGGPCVQYAVLEGTAWVSETVDSVMVAGPSLALDSLGGPHVAYVDVRRTPPRGPGAGLRYARRLASGWAIESAELVKSDSVSLALDSRDNPYIAYCDTDSGVLKVAAWDGVGWSITPVEAGGRSPCLKLDRFDVPHLAYLRPDATVCYAILGPTWVSETVGSETATGISLAVDSEGMPHIAYADSRPSPPEGAGLGLRYAYRTAAGWVVQTVDPATSTSPSLALTGSGAPGIAYCDPIAADLKYAQIECPLHLPLALKGS